MIREGLSRHVNLRWPMKVLQRAAAPLRARLAALDASTPGKFF
jgi:hypothetical protein